MCSGAICGDDHTYRPWWPTEERWDIPADKKVFTDCCYRRVPARETICRVRSQEYPVGGFGCYQKVWLFGYEMQWLNWFTFASYYGPTWTVECNPDGGCKVNKRKKLGMHLREPVYVD